MRRGRGEGEEGKDVHSIHYFIHESSPFAPSLFRFSPSPFPPETPDTQARLEEMLGYQVAPAYIRTGTRRSYFPAPSKGF